MKNTNTKAKLEDVVRAMCETTMNIVYAVQEGKSPTRHKQAMLKLWDKFDNLVAELES